MNRLYLFNTWVVLFFIVITALFLGAVFFYMLQLYLLNKKNKRFKNQNLDTDERKRNYGKNLKLAAKLDVEHKILASIDKNELQFKRTKKIKKDNCKFKLNYYFLFENAFFRWYYINFNLVRLDKYLK